MWNLVCVPLTSPSLQTFGRMAKVTFVDYKNVNVGSVKNVDLERYFCRVLLGRVKIGFKSSVRTELFQNRIRTV